MRKHSLGYEWFRRPAQPGNANNLLHEVRGWFRRVELKMSRRQDGPSRTGGSRGAYLNGYVTGERRSRRLIFSLTFWGRRSLGDFGALLAPSKIANSCRGAAKE
ncbi:MAG: hypothetical protein JO298_08580 [Verrucomicrobia bacterium]|nr:hypothetical protein [Verrucomicrobiota bacterium]